MNIYFKLSSGGKKYHVNEFFELKSYDHLPLHVKNLSCRQRATLTRSSSSRMENNFHFRRNRLGDNICRPVYTDIAACKLRYRCIDRIPFKTSTVNEVELKKIIISLTTCQKILKAARNRLFVDSRAKNFNFIEYRQQNSNLATGHFQTRNWTEI